MKRFSRIYSICAGIILPALAAFAAPVPPAAHTLPFIANQGQIRSSDVLFHTRTFSGAAYLTQSGEIVYTVKPSGGHQNDAMLVLRETLVGARPARPVGVDPSSALVNFLTGPESAWRTGVPAYYAVDLPDVYRDIHLQLRAVDRNVEKIFTVLPGADPEDIRMRLEGADALSVNTGGELEAGTALGSVRFTRPVAWQEVAGERRPVEVAYQVSGREFGFSLGAYDPQLPLIIDPLLAGTFAGGSGEDVINALAKDTAGNIYAAGYTASDTDFPMATGVVTNYQGGAYDAVAMKFDAQLHNLLAATFLGGDDVDQATSIVFNPDNNCVYVGGFTASTNFTGGATLQGSQDAFIVRLNADLTAPVTLMLGGDAADAVNALAVRNNQIYAAGYTASTNFPATTGAHQEELATPGATNAFAAVINAANNAIAVSYLGGTQSDIGTAITVNNNSHVIVAGYTISPNFPVGGTNYQNALPGPTAAFVSRFNANLTTLPASTFLGGASNDFAAAVGVDIDNRVYVAGYTLSDDFPTNNSFGTSLQPTYGDNGDGFVTRFNEALSSCEASTFLGGGAQDAITALRIVSDVTETKIFVAGYTSSGDFPTTPNVLDRTFNGIRDAFFATINDQLTDLASSTYFGGDQSDTALAVLPTSGGRSAYIAGATASADLPIPPAGYQSEPAGGTDGFIAHLGTRYGGVKWQARLFDYDDQDASGRFGTPAMGWDGTVYVGAGSNLFAFNPDGSLKWQFHTSTATDGRIIPAYETDWTGLGPAPAVDTNGTIYIGASTAQGSAGTSRLYAINPDGTLRWTFNADGAIYSTPAIGLDGNIYFGSYLNRFYALDSNGNLLWHSYEDATTTIASPALDSAGNVYALRNHGAAGNATLYSYDPDTGNTNWSFNRAGSGYSSPIIDNDGMIYVCIGNTVYKVNPATGSQDTSLAMTNAIFSSPAISSNDFLFVANGNQLRAYDLSQAPVSLAWTCHTDGNIKSSPSVGDGGNIYVSGVSNLYSFAFNGTTNWSFATQDTIDYHSSMLSTEGTVYIADIRRIYALYGPVPSDDESSWPTFSRDVLRTGNAGFDPRPHAAPRNLSVSKGVPRDRILLNWDTVDNVIHYEVYRNTVDDSATAERIRTLTSAGMTDTNIERGLIYYYWLRARTHVVPLSSFSVGDFGGTPPLPPTGVTATKGVPTNYVQIVWQPSAHATEYDLYRAYDVNDTNSATLLADALVATNFNDHTVTPGRTHYYWVKAKNIQGYVSDHSSSEGDDHSGGIPPLPPGVLTAGKGLTSTNIPISWSTAPYASTYLVHRSTETNPIFAAEIANITAPTRNFDDTDSIPFRPYFYWVRATNQYGISGYSMMDSGYTILLPPLSVSASTDRTNRVAVSWQVESENATRYIVYRGATTNAHEATLQAELPYIDNTSTNFTDYGIERGVEYYYFVKARNVYGTSDFSDHSNLGGTFPTAPTGLTASNGDPEHAILLNWSPPTSPGTRGYRIFRSDTFDPGAATLLGTTIVGDREFFDTASEPGQYYYYWVTATNYLGSSRFSGIASGSRPLPPPDSVTAGNGESTNLITVTWNSARNASHYEVWRNTVNNSDTAVKLANNWSALVYEDDDTAAGEIYYYWIKSKNNAFTSVFSRPASGFRASGLVDLAVSGLVFKPNVLSPGDRPRAASFNVVNRGPQSMLAPNKRVSVDFHLSTSPTFVEEQSIWCGGFQLDLALTPNAGRLYTLTPANLAMLRIPEVPDGLYYIFVYVRHSLPSTWHDPVPANNHVSRLGGPVRINATGAARQLFHDYDGDGKADPVIYRESDGTWRALLSGSGYTEVALTGLGGPGFQPVPADYDGDGITDPAVYRQSDGTWRARLSGSGYAEAGTTGFGGPGFQPVPADYDGDGITDPAVYRQSDGTWRAWFSGSGYAETAVTGHGGPGWLAAPGGYDYDAFTDPAVYHVNTGIWHIWPSSLGYARQTLSGWGDTGLLPVPGDYNGDGLNDLALYHAASGYWFIRTLSGETLVWGMHWGGADHLPVAGDFTGNGRADLTVYHRPTGRWYVRTVTGGIFANGVVFGGPDFIPAGTPGN